MSKIQDKSALLRKGLTVAPVSRGTLGFAERVAEGVTHRTMDKLDMAVRAGLVTAPVAPKPNRRARRAAGVKTAPAPAAPPEFRICSNCGGVNLAHAYVCALCGHQE